MSGDVYDHTSGRLSDLDNEVVRHVPPGGNWRDLPADFKSARIAQIRRSAAAGEGSRSTYYGRLAGNRPSYTISTYFNRPGNGCFIHPNAPRLITIREAARLQSFPDRYRFLGRGRARFMQVGNAVPPLLAYQIASALGGSARFVDLFSGAGGLSLGFEWAGCELVAAVDNEPSCIATMVRNGAEARRVLQRDLAARGALPELLEEVVGLNGGSGPEMLIGGPPCQGFSTAGKNQTHDPRNRLVEVFLEAVVTLRPRVVLMENVAALTFRRGRSTLDEIIAMLDQQGYKVGIAVLHAEGYGVPQLRRRLFVQAVLGGEIRWPLPQCHVIPPHHMTLQPGGLGVHRRREAPTVAEAISDLPTEAGSDPDIPKRYVMEPANGFQRWARGIISTPELLPATEVVIGEDQPTLQVA